MDVQALPPPQHSQRSHLTPTRIISLLASCIVLLGGMASAQSTRSPRTTTQKRKPVSEAQAALETRIREAEAAKRSGKAVAVQAANERLAALALRELAQLRLVEAAYPQSIELYKRSLDFDDNPDTHVDLAIAYLQAEQYDQSLAESAKALAMRPDDRRAAIVRGKTLMSKGDYGEAAKVIAPIVDSSKDPNLEMLYSLAICYLQSEKTPAKAQHVFEEMKEIAGESGSLHVLFGRAYRDANDLPLAVKEFERAIAVDNKTPHAHYFLGLANLALNEWKVTPRVKTEFLKELANYPQDYLANYMMGYELSAERKYEESDKYLEAAAKIKPEWPDPWLYLGINAYARNDKQRAEETFRKAIELTTDESRSNYQIRLAYIDLGRILVMSGRRKEGEKYLTKARELQNEVFRSSQQSMAQMAGGMGSAVGVVPLSSKLETEVAPLTSANVDPFARLNADMVQRSELTAGQQAAANAQEDHLRAVLGLAFSDMATSEAVMGEYMAALGHYQEAEKWDANIDGLERNLGLSAFKTHNYPEAIHGFAAALKTQPGDNPVRALLGMAYFGAEKYEDAVKTFQPLGVAGMQDGSVGYAWAASLTHLNRQAEAGQVLQEFEKPERPVQTKMMIGQLWLEIGDYAKAVATFHSVLESDPKMQKAHYFAGEADLRWGHWSEAEQEFRSELKLDPADVETKYQLGVACLQQSRVDEAETIFKQVVEEYPNHAGAQYNLGKILLDKGDLDGAVKHLEIATRLSPNSDYMHYQLQLAYRKQSRIEDADRELAVYKQIKEKQRGLTSGGMGSSGTGSAENEIR